MTPFAYALLIFLGGYVSMQFVCLIAYIWDYFNQSSERPVYPHVVAIKANSRNYFITGIIHLVLIYLTQTLGWIWLILVVVLVRALFCVLAVFQILANLPILFSSKYAWLTYLSLLMVYILPMAMMLQLLRLV